MIDIVISNSSNKPIYQQIFDQLSAQVLNGDILPGTMLPPIRTVAKELRISVITVKKAWETLEREGFIYSMVGRGCFVADLSARDLAHKKSALVSTKLAKDIAYYKDMGLSLDDVIRTIRKLW